MKRHTITSIAVLVVGFAFLGFMLLKPSDAKVFRSETAGLTLNYPETAVPQKITEQDKKDKIIFRASQQQGEEEFLVTLRYEDGLRTAAGLSRLQPIDLVLNGAEKALPERFPEYRQISLKRFTQEGRPAAEINFEYRGLSKEAIRQRFLIVMRDDDTAVYLAGQAKKEDFEKLRKDFDQIFNSLRIE